MSAGEALVYGLLGGTVGATDHYYTDWKDRVARARNQAELEDQRTHDSKVRQEEWDQREKEAKTERTFRTQERQADQLFQAGQNKLSREHDLYKQTSQNEYQAGQNEAEVNRQARLYDTKQQIDENYHKKTVQFGWDDKNQQLVPITKDNQQSLSMVPVAERDKDGNFQWLGNVDTKGKGLLGRSGSGSGKGVDPYTNVKLPTGNPLSPTEERTIYTDSAGKQYQIVPDGQGNMIRIPFEMMEEPPNFVSPEQTLAADQFADKTVNDMAKYFATDATDFSDWGGSREAAKEYFRQNYLQGNHLDEQGRLRLPGSNQPTAAPQQTNTTPVVQSNDITEEFNQLYSSLSQEEQLTLRDATVAMQQNGRNREEVFRRLIEYGFTQEQLNILFGLSQ